MVDCKTLLIVNGLMLTDEPRPDSIGYEDDPVTGARCHYNREAHADRCAKVFEVLQDAWTAQTDAGWPEPFSDEGQGGTDGLDIYISRDAEGGAYVDSTYVDAVDDDDRRGAWSHMVLDPGIDPDEYPDYVAHEFNHVLQFAMDFTEPTLPPWEGAATRAEELTYAGNGSGPTVAPDYNKTPWVGFLLDGWWLWDEYEIWSYYEYGSVLFFDDLREEEGFTASDYWWAMVNAAPKNEPDSLDALEDLTGDAEQYWIEFGIRRAKMGTSEAPEWAQEAYPDAALGTEGTLSVGDTIEAEYGVYDWGFVAVDIAEDGEIDVEGEAGVEWAVVSVGRELELVTPAEVHAGERVLVFNFGPPEFDGDDTPGQRALSLTLGALPADTGLDDTGVEERPRPPGGEEPGPGCGCSAGAGSVGGLALLLGLTLVRRRDGAPRGAGEPGVELSPTSAEP